MVCSIYPTDPLLLELTVSQMENTITELQETTRSLMVRVTQLEGLHQRVKRLEHALMYGPTSYSSWQPPSLPQFDQMAYHDDASPFLSPSSPTVSPFRPSHPASSSVAPHNPTALYSPSLVVPQSSPGLYPSQGPPQCIQIKPNQTGKIQYFLLLASIRPYFLSLIQPCESIQAFVRNKRNKVKQKNVFISSQWHFLNYSWDNLSQVWDVLDTFVSVRLHFSSDVLLQLVPEVFDWVQVQRFCRCFLQGKLGSSGFVIGTHLFINNRLYLRGNLGQTPRPRLSGNSASLLVSLDKLIYSTSARLHLFFSEKLCDSWGFVASKV